MQSGKTRLENGEKSLRRHQPSAMKKKGGETAKPEVEPRSSFKITMVQFTSILNNFLFVKHPIQKGGSFLFHRVENNRYEGNH